jgi:hypothetical protein
MRVKFKAWRVKIKAHRQPYEWGIFLPFTDSSSPDPELFSDLPS